LGWLEIGYHAGIELIADTISGAKYEYQIGRPLDMVGAHTKGMNDTSVGICLVGNFDLEEPSHPQYFMLASLCRAFQMRFDIPIQNILPHWAFADKTCPGLCFNFLKFREYVRGFEQ
jgi:N-acetylmuramoyl-L-alanine amidase